MEMVKKHSRYGRVTPYRGFEIVEKKIGGTVSFNVFKDGEQYSFMELASIDVAKRILKAHLPTEQGIIKDCVMPEMVEWEVKEPATVYSNSGYLQTMEKYS